MDVWSKDHPFPIDIDYMISDTLELLRPKMRISGSLEEAAKQVADLEREVLVKLGTLLHGMRRPLLAGDVCTCAGRAHWPVGLSGIPWCASRSSSSGWFNSRRHTHTFLMPYSAGR